MTKPDDRLTEVVTLRLTAAERELLGKYAAGRALGSTIREIVGRALRPQRSFRPAMGSAMSVGWSSAEVWAAGVRTENHGGPLHVTCSHPGATYASRPGFIQSVA